MTVDWQRETWAERIMVALDVDGERARQLADELAGTATWVKIGMTLYYAEGPAVVADMKRRGFKVFLDLKLHDIPHQVQGAAYAAACAGADLLTLHASGSAAMMQAACAGIEKAHAETGNDTALIAVTVLTSMDEAALQSVGVTRPVSQQVSALAQLAVDSGCQGVVCSPLEAQALRAQLGSAALIVTPGVRLASQELGDQTRVATPAFAFNSGASHIVVGRPIVQADFPKRAFMDIAMNE